jgi:hypothetical protein
MPAGVTRAVDERMIDAAARAHPYDAQCFSTTDAALSPDDEAPPGA